MRGLSWRRALPRCTAVREPGGLPLRLADALGMTRLRETVLLPAVADMQHECREAGSGPRHTWVLARGYWALLAGCAFYAACLPSRHLRENWTGLDAPGPRLLRMTAPVAALVVAVVVVLDVAIWPNPRQLPPDVIALLLPSFVLTVVPLALAIGVAWALTRDPSMSCGTLGVGLLGALSMFVFFDAAVAPSNQAYRVASYRMVTGNETALRRGSREMTFRELGVAMVVAGVPACPKKGGSCSGATEQSEAWLRSEWHNRLSIPTLALSFVILAAGLSRNRRRIVVIPGLCLSFVAACSILQAGQRLGVRGEVPVVLGAWAAHLVPLALVGCLLLSGRGRSAPGVTRRWSLR